MKDMILTLEEPSMKYKDQFLDLCEKYRAENPLRFASVIDLIQSDFDAYLRYLERMATGQGMPPGFTRQITYWLILNNAFLIGTSTVRPYPFEQLKLDEGHIRYDISPDHRRNGYATRLLHMTLEKAKEFGLSEVILTCKAGSEGSVKTIMNNGGVYTGEFIHSRLVDQYFRYKIEI
jgi:predicted acetyltransferase